MSYADLECVCNPEGRCLRVALTAGGFGTLYYTAAVVPQTSEKAKGYTKIP